MNAPDESPPSAMENSNDLQAYVTLMTKYQGNLRAFIVALIPGSPDVDDVLQETNAALWQKRERFVVGTNFLAWAFQIARYEVHRSRDRAKRLHRLVFSEKLVELMVEEEGVAEDGHRRLIDALDQCLEKLTKNQREIVHHRYTPGLTLERLAEKTGRAPGGLRVALLRIREGLRTCIERKLASHPS